MGSLRPCSPRRDQRRCRRAMRHTSWPPVDQGRREHEVGPDESWRSCRPPWTRPASRTPWSTLRPPKTGTAPTGTSCSCGRSKWGRPESAPSASTPSVNGQECVKSLAFITWIDFLTRLVSPNLGAEVTKPEKVIVSWLGDGRKSRDNGNIDDPFLGKMSTFECISTVAFVHEKCTHLNKFLHFSNMLYQSCQENIFSSQ